MTKRSSKRWQNFERDRILGSFVSGKPTGEFGGNADELDALLKRKQGSAEVSVAQDVGQESLSAGKGPRPENDDRQAIERGEDEGMMVGRE